MSACNLQPLPGQVTDKAVLYVDLSAGHSAISEEADKRFLMLDTITRLLSIVKTESVNDYDQANLCLTLNSLLQEAHGLYAAAYRLAVSASISQGMPNGASDK